MSAEQVANTAEQLRHVLSRIDRDKDGMLNFREFKAGIKSIGLPLSDNEMQKIWHEAGSTVSEAAGVRTFREGTWPGQVQEVARTAKKRYDEERAHADQIDRTLVPKHGVDLSCVDGRHSKKKIHNKMVQGTIINMGSGIGSGQADPVGVRISLAPPDNMRGSLPQHSPQKRSPPRGRPQTLTSFSPNAHLDITSAPAYTTEYAGVKKAIIERGGRGAEWAANMEEEKEAENDKGKGIGSALRAGIVNERILNEVVAKDQRVRKAIRVVSKDGDGKTVVFDELKDGLAAAGLLLGDGDCKAVWAAAGGNVSHSGDAAGVVDVDAFLHKMSIQKSLQDSKASSGYAAHMRSNDGVVAPHDPDQPPVRGKKRANFTQNPIDDHAHAVDEAIFEEKHTRSNTDRFSKWEEHVKTELKEHKAEVRKVFKVYEPGSLEEKEARGQGGLHGVPLGYGELRQNLKHAGINVSDKDYESLWRRADKECLGTVTYRDLLGAFSVSQMHEAKSPSRKKYALPHLLHAEEITPLREKHVRTSARDHIGLHMLQSNPLFMHELRGALGSGDVSEQKFKECLKSANVVVSDSDATELYRYAGNGGRVTESSITNLFRPTENIVKPQRPVSLLGFGTGDQHSKTGGPLEMYQGTWGTQDPMIHSLYSKIAESNIGNPHRLRRAFRKYDVDRNGQVSRSEFVQTIFTNGAPISREETDLLAKIVDVQGSGTVSYEKFIDEMLKVGQEPPPKKVGGGVLKGGVRPETSRSSLMAETNSSVMKKNERRGSVSSVRSTSSMASISSQRSTSSFMGPEAERSQWLTDSRMRGGRSERPQSASARQSGNSAPLPPKILHLAAPPPTAGV